MSIHLSSPGKRYQNALNPRKSPMNPVVLVGHLHRCPLHGKGHVTTGASDASIDGKPIARVGDSISCGAVIQTGSTDTLIEGRPVACLGDTTSHGGTLIEGDGDWLVE